MSEKPSKQPEQQRDWIYEKIPIPDKLDLPKIKLHTEVVQKSDLLPIYEAAEELNTTVHYVYHLFHLGKLKGKKVNGRYCIFRKSIENYRRGKHGVE